ncbi:MAG: NADPH-dependent FMN reductase [Phycisphaerae bacterium]|nr:NADPH-dependent FMN reductase [Phycisphaerae bacterium]MAT80852.1 NADPH-dependent FMN reductase [Phycisphaerae bacterium]
MPPRILAFSGSLRRDSWNHKLVEIAADAARDAGAEVTVIRLRDYPMPVFDEDLEADQGLPQEVMALREQFKSHQGLLIASPEYNSSVTAALKNTIDWLSRTPEGCAPLECFDQKIAGLMAASPGGLGGLKGLSSIRWILGNIRVTVLPRQVAVPRIHEVLQEPGRLSVEALQEQITLLGREVAETASKMHDLPA